GWRETTMRRRKRDPVPEPPAQFHHNPFRQLATAARRARVEAPVATPAPAPPPAAADADDGLFEREMAGGRPLSHGGPARVAPPPPAPAERAVTDPDAEALAELSDLVTGAGPFDVANSVECVEGAVAGLDRRVLRRLRGGDFAYQAHLDLHGMTAEEARG